MISLDQLNWIRDHHGQIKAQMRRGKFWMIVAWTCSSTGSVLELQTEDTDTEWWDKVCKLDPSAKDVK